MEIIHELIIIGSGPAGLTAAIYAARAKLNPIIIAGPNPGGQLVSTTYVENWPGEKSILGADLMLKITEHAKQFGTTFIDQNVTKVDFQGHPFKIWTSDNQALQTKAVIIATGANPKKLNCPGEAEYWSKGVSTCAICDGALYYDQNVVVVGGGDTAMEDALFMTRFNNQVTLVQINDRLTASKIMQDRVLNNPNIKVIYNSTVIKINGDGHTVTDVLINNIHTQKTQTIITNAVFIAIGLRPVSGIFEEQIKIDHYGHIVVECNTRTSIPGIFAAGDICDRLYRQAITSAGFGCMAALEAERYLSAL